MSSRQVLFLDVDGVLHRGSSYRRGNDVVSGAAGRIELFEFAPVLDELLQPYPSVEIVFSSDWALALGVDYTRDKLPCASLRRRVVGAAYQGCQFDAQLWPMLTRGGQVLDYVQRHSLLRWLAIDDRRDGFEGHRERLIH